MLATVLPASLASLGQALVVGASVRAFLGSPTLNSTTAGGLVTPGFIAWIVLATGCAGAMGLGLLRFSVTVLRLFWSVRDRNGVTDPRLLSRLDLRPGEDARVPVRHRG
jgi:hypothetical protein